MQDKRAVTLKTTGAILRPWKEEEAGWYVESRDEEIFRWTSEKRELRVQEVEAAIRRVNASDDVISWAIVDHQRDELLGNMALEFKMATQSAEISYFLASWGRGRGIATGALIAVCEWAFANLDVVYIRLRTHPDNIRSQQVALRAGFQAVRHGAEVDEAASQDAEDEASPFSSWFKLSKDAP